MSILFIYGIYGINTINTINGIYNFKIIRVYSNRIQLGQNLSRNEISHR